MQGILFSRKAYGTLAGSLFLIALATYFYMFPDFLLEHRDTTLALVFGIVALLLLLLAGKYFVGYFLRISETKNLVDILKNFARVGSQSNTMSEFLFDLIMSEGHRPELIRYILNGEIDLIFQKQKRVSLEHVRQIKSVAKEAVFEKTKDALDRVLELECRETRMKAFVSVMKNELTQTLVVLGCYPENGATFSDKSFIIEILTDKLKAVDLEELEAWATEALTVLKDTESFLNHNHDGFKTGEGERLPMYIIHNHKDCHDVKDGELSWYEQNRYIPKPLTQSGVLVFQTVLFQSDYKSILDGLRILSSFSVTLKSFSNR